MIICDLNYWKDVCEGCDNPEGGATVAVGSDGLAIGEETFVVAKSKSWSISLPYNGSIAAGYAYAVSFAYNPPSIPIPELSLNNTGDDNFLTDFST